MDNPLCCVVLAARSFSCHALHIYLTPCISLPFAQVTVCRWDEASSTFLLKEIGVDRFEVSRAIANAAL